MTEVTRMLGDLPLGAKIKLPKGKGVVYTVGEYGKDYLGKEGIKLIVPGPSGRFYCKPKNTEVIVVDAKGSGSTATPSTPAPALKVNNTLDGRHPGEKVVVKEGSPTVSTPTTPAPSAPEEIMVGDKKCVEMGTYSEYFRKARVGDEFFISDNGYVPKASATLYGVEDIDYRKGLLYITWGSPSGAIWWSPTYPESITIFKVIKETPTTEEQPKEVKKPVAKMSLMDYIKSQGIDSAFVKRINAWRREHALSIKDPLYPKVKYFYLGAEQLQLSLAALLAGHHLLLEGPAGSGKNTLAATCAYIMGAPLSEIQGHRHLDGDGIIGHEIFKSHIRDVQDFVEAYDTFKSKGMSDAAISGALAACGRKDEVTFLHGTVLIGARDGHFVVIDEANTIPPESLIITHSLRDERRRLEVPGYGLVQAHPRFRMILTLNYGYAGTGEMNKATADGFVPVHVPPMSEDNFATLLMGRYYDYGLKQDKANIMAGLFHDILGKAGDSEDGSTAQISDRPVSVRAIFQSLDLILQGIKPITAVSTCFLNRTPDPFERKVVGDVINTRFRTDWTRDSFFDFPDGRPEDSDGIEEVE